MELPNSDKVEASARREKSFRTTFFLTDVLDHNLTLLSRETGISKKDLITQEAKRILEDHGYSTDKKATFTIKKEGEKE